MRDPVPGSTGAPTAPSGQQTLTILYIAGPGRTGSTLLGNALNEVPGYFHAGELLALWQMLATHSPTGCGCGAEIPDCPVWSRVLATPLPEDEGTIGDQAARAYAWTESIPFPELVAQLRSGVRLPRDDETLAYLRLIGATYRAIQAATGARVIVDSSKAPISAAAATALEGVRTFILHLVRDPRAVAYSWLNPKGHLARQTARFSARYWRQANLATEALKRGLPAGSSITVRYEDFVAAPADVLGRVVRALGDPKAPLPVGPDRRLILRGNHTVIGNPDRSATGAVAVTSDSRWQRSLSRRDSGIVALSAYPMMRRYGYRWLGARRRTARPEPESPPAVIPSRRTRGLTALAVLPVAIVTLLMSGWWLVAASTAAPVRGALSFKPLAEVASHVASLPLPASVPGSVPAKKGLILNRPWLLDHPTVSKVQAERIAKVSVPGRSRVAGAVLASIETEKTSDLDCLCWVVFLRRGGNPSMIYTILVDAGDGKRVSADQRLTAGRPV